MSFCHIKTNKKSFSLPELSVVIAVLSFLIFTSVRSLKNVFNQTQANVDAQKIKIVKQALQTYFNTHGHLPAPADYTLTNNDVNYGKSKTEKSSYDGTLDADIFAYKWDKKLIPHIEEIEEEIEIPLQQANTNLPDEYQEVEYIESTGTQYIDTGVSGTSIYGIEMNIIPMQQLTNNQSNTMCQLGGPTNNGTIGQHYDFKWYLRWQTNDYQITGSYAGTWGYYNTTSVNNIVIKDGKFYVNDSLIYSGYTGSFSNSNSNIYIFNCFDLKFPAITRLYSLKLYNNNNTLLRDFVPCYRKSDGEIGLYDKVEGKFYTNKGTGTFLKGSDICTASTQTITIPKQTLTHTEEDCGKQKTNMKYNVYRGIVPFKELGFTEDDVIDSKGNFFEYYVPEVMTLTRNIKPSNVEGENFISNGYVIKPTKGESEYIKYSCPAKKAETPSGICEITKNNLYGMEFTESVEEQIKIAKPVYNTIKYETQEQYTQQIDNIPHQYQEVEYIDTNCSYNRNATNSNCPYIDTGVKTTTNGIGIEGKIVVGGTNADDWQQIFGNRNTNGKFGLWWYLDNTGLFWETDQQNNCKIASNNINHTDPFTIKISGNTFNINGYTTTCTNTKLNGTTNLLLFDVNDSTESVRPMKLYYWKIYDGNTIVRDFIPCYRKSDGVIGLYDKVEEKFYTNKGSGTFLKGNDIDNKVAQIRTINIPKTLSYTTYELVDDVKQCVSRYIQSPYGLRVKNVNSNNDIEPNGSIAYMLISHGEDGDKTCALKKPKVLGQSPIVVNYLENADKINKTNKFEAQNCFNAVKQDTYNLVSRSDFLTGTNTEYMFYKGAKNADFDDIVEYSTLAELIKGGAGVNY